MFTIRWMGEYSPHSVTFDDGWNRLNYSNAATFKSSTWSSENAQGREVKTERFYLVSYATPILYIQRKYYMDDASIISVSINIDEYNWHCSRATISQISRFCRMLDFFFGIDITYIEIRDAMRSTNMHFGFDMCIKDRTYIYRHTPREIREVFERECPKFWYQ